MSIDTNINSNYIEVENLKLHYLSIGSGEPILLLHGWPTCSYLWRNIMPPLATRNQVIALDLPGFGKSDKPLDVSYSFKFYNSIINSFLEKLEISKTHLVVHDLGGPVGLLWAVRQPQKVHSLVLLNTLVYPQMSLAVKMFIMATFIPVLKNWMSSPSGIARGLRFGVQNKKNLTAEILSNYQTPFQTKEARKALRKAAQNLSAKGFAEIAKKLPDLKIPTCIIYGENDRILPDVSVTMKRVVKDLPQTQLHILANCGHFLQEDKPEEISELLIEFFTSQKSVE